MEHFCWVELKTAFEVFARTAYWPHAEMLRTWSKGQLFNRHEQEQQNLEYRGQSRHKNEILSWFTYSHRFSSMDHVTWIREVVLEGALYCYSNFLPIGLRELPYIFFTDECAIHRSDMSFSGQRNTRTLHRSWNKFRLTLCCVKLLDCVWNVMAHVQKPDFFLSAKRTSQFKSAGGLVQSTTGSRGVRISSSNGSNAGYTMFRGGVKGTGYPLHSPVSPSLPLPCVTVCHHFSTGLCYIRRGRAVFSKSS